MAGSMRVAAPADSQQASSAIARRGVSARTTEGLGPGTEDQGPRDQGPRDQGLPNLLELLQMMDVMPRELGRHPLRRQLAELGMGERSRALGGRHPLEHREV